MDIKVGDYVYLREYNERPNEPCFCRFMREYIGTAHKVIGTCITDKDGYQRKSGSTACSSGWAGTTIFVEELQKGQNCGTPVAWPKRAVIPVEPSDPMIRFKMILEEI